MVPVTIKLDEDSLAQLDAFIESGAAGNRTEALRAALRSWLRAQRDAELVEQYRRGYGTYPEEEDPDLSLWHSEPATVDASDELGDPWNFDA